MKKYICGLLLAAAMLLALVPSAVFGATTVNSGTCGTNLTWTLDSDGVLTVSGSGAMTNYSAASNAPWYAYKSSVKSVVIKDGVTSIGTNAFYGYAGITGSVVIPDSVTAVGKNAFYQCSSMESLTIGSGVTSIGKDAFSICYKLKEIIFRPVSMADITLSDNAYNEFFAYAGRDSGGIRVIFDSTVKRIPARLLYSTSAGNERVKVTAVTIGDNVEYIGKDAFTYCNMTDLVIPDSVTSVGSYAFSYCTALQSVTIGDGLPSISSGAFRNCSALKTVTLGKKVAVISSYGFYGCSALRDINLDGNLVLIENSAFYRCTALTGVTLGKAMETIEDNAFSGCTGLTEVKAYGNLYSIGKNAFSGANKLADVYFYGNAPKAVNAAAFPARTITGHYPCGNATWNASALPQFGNATFTWEKIHTALVDCAGMPATCCSAGWEPYQLCRNCPSYTTKREIPMLEHQIVEHTTQPDMTEQGYTVRYCETCTLREVTYIPALYDVDEDMQVDAKDLTLLLRHVAKIETVTEPELLERMDLDGDGDITAADVTKLAVALGTVK